MRVEVWAKHHHGDGRLVLDIRDWAQGASYSIPVTRDVFDSVKPHDTIDLTVTKLDLGSRR